MQSLDLILFSRNGCCLCEALEQRLRRLSFNEIQPPVELHIIDIDNGAISSSEREKYDLIVPVMLLRSRALKKDFILPRPSPRLNQEGFFYWLQKAITKTIGSD